MTDLYSRNRFYITEYEQEIVRNTRLLFGGAGIGSNIAECALRFGFERITLIDGDVVELSNLNRQNYKRADIGRYKAEALAERLLKINPDASISCHCEYITEDNVSRLVDKCDIAINALDFNSRVPFIFDDRCRAMNVPILHPYNFGWGGLLMIVTRESRPLSSLVRNSDPKGFELAIAKYVAEYRRNRNMQENDWLHTIVEKYTEENDHDIVPQLSVGSWIVGAMCVEAMFQILMGKPVKQCPKFYLTSMDKNSIL